MKFEVELRARPITYPGHHWGWNRIEMSQAEKDALLDALELLRLIATSRDFPTDAWRSNARAALAALDRLDEKRRAG